MEQAPAISVVIVSDYAGGEEKAWDDLRLLLEALARQDADEVMEVLLVESDSVAAKIPPDLLQRFPSARIVTYPASSSYELKNEGVAAASADIVAVLDADCVPAPDWLRHLLLAMRAHPEFGVVSGRTTYPGRSLGERILSLLSRSYLDPGHAGENHFISNNNSAFRRQVYLQHPLPTDAGAFANRLQSEEILRHGGRLYFEPRMRVIHDFEGWAMEGDIRRNIGYGTIVTRLRDERVPYAWLTRLSYTSIPLFVVAKTLDSFWDCLRCHRHYGVEWYQLPLAFALAIVTHVMEAPGMARGFAGRPITETAYR